MQFFKLFQTLTLYQNQFIFIDKMLDISADKNCFRNCLRIHYTIVLTEVWAQRTLFEYETISIKFNAI